VKELPPPDNNAQTPVPETAVRSQLAAVLASKPFVNAHRSKRFLEFAVQQTLAGAQESVKESVIALEVFDRNGDFDGRIDAIVRVEASKLRTRLHEYYTGEGSTSPVTIDIPKGTYVPQFSQRPEAADETFPKISSPTPNPWILRTGVACGVLLIVVIGLWYALGSRFKAAPAARDLDSIAVLPFLNLSSEPENEYFGDGLADQLTDALAQVDGLRVASRTSAFSFRGTRLQATEIGAKLGVSSILEGSVQKSGTRVRITLQCIQTRDGYHLWSQTFDRELKNVFELQDEISRAVIRALNVTLADDASRRMSQRYTRDPEAFDLYLRGRHALDTFRPGAPAQAIALFQRAVDRDPKFALGYAGIAVGASFGMFSGTIPPSELRNQIKSAAEKALAIDDTLVEAQAVLATVEARFDWNWTGAEARLRNAIKLNPRSAEVHLAYAQGVLLPLRRFDEALAECSLAVALDPFYAQTAYCTPWVHIIQGKAELALNEFQKLRADSLSQGAFKGGIAIAMLHSGREADAISLMHPGKLDIARLLNQSQADLGFLAYSYGRVGRTGEAQEIARQLEIAKRSRYVSPGVLCLIYLGMGRVAEARSAALEQIREHEANVYYLAMDPLFAQLRTEPQFLASLKTVGLPF